MPGQISYEKLSQDNSRGDESLLDHDVEEDGATHGNRHPSRPFTGYYTIFTTFLVLVASNLLTWHLTASFYHDTSSGVESNAVSRYAGLKWDVEHDLDGPSPYTDPDDTKRNEHWKALNIDKGIIALPNDYASEVNLPPTQPFPWDEEKGIYLVQGHHSLHCVRAAYIALQQYREGTPQTQEWHHVVHCLDTLRRDAICYADDTPRWTALTRTSQTGHGQPRQCRNWEKLEEWAEQYNACYRYTNETSTPEEFPRIQRFVWCPKDSPYRKEVEKYFDVDYENE